MSEVESSKREEGVGEDLYMLTLLLPEDVEDLSDLMPAILSEEEAGSGSQVKG